MAQQLNGFNKAYHAANRMEHIGMHLINKIMIKGLMRDFKVFRLMNASMKIAFLTWTAVHFMNAGFFMTVGAASPFHNVWKMGRELADIILKRGYKATAARYFDIGRRALAIKVNDTGGSIKLKHRELLQWYGIENIDNVDIPIQFDSPLNNIQHEYKETKMAINLVSQIPSFQNASQIATPDTTTSPPIVKALPSENFTISINNDTGYRRVSKGNNPITNANARHDEFINKYRINTQDMQTIYQRIQLKYADGTFADGTTPTYQQVLRTMIIVNEFYIAVNNQNDSQHHDNANNNAEDWDWDIGLNEHTSANAGDTTERLPTTQAPTEKMKPKSKKKKKRFDTLSSDAKSHKNTDNDNNNNSNNKGDNVV